MGGKYFEKFAIGQTFEHEIRRTVTDVDNILFSSPTNNPAAIHIDHEYCKTTEFGKPLINSIFTLDTTVGDLGWKEVAFPKPAFASGAIRAVTKVVAPRDSKSRPTQGLVTFEHQCLKQKDDIACSCRRVALMLRRPS